ncbi:hypothetical protein WG68_07980 [Arsukibacterium ikkense]|uniref:Metallo-beta-lactamase domain-containing protein n=1 Tax=Arsukibacterium ikkense TaxID=336831 RepID=A0A0M2V5L9_9GAMM|nr:MBL fold metallo-hydrolase [Arsukibacterium ikkense]KKO45936.1 hypothetical protein WG68_07980 [Arsukibacterium ikkense]
MLKKNKTALLVLCLALIGCSQTDNLLVQFPGIPEDAAGIVKRGERFKNLYPTPESYPLQCQYDCYQPQSVLQCNQKASQCLIDWPFTVLEPVGLTLTWFGHASFELVLPQGQRVLFDPVSAGFDWPINWLAALAGDRRQAPPRFITQRNAPVSAVFFSHAHFDHLNKADLKQLGASPDYYLPYGMARYFPQRGYRLHEMSWYSSVTAHHMQIHFVPAHHYSGRGLYALDGDKSLWGGWILEIDGYKVYFAGDTGYSPIFKDIQRKYGNMDLCLLPIGSYHGPNYRNAHLAPEDALTVAQELNCRAMIPWGYGNYSWNMGDISSHSALKRLLTMYQREQPEVQLLVLNEGEGINL